MKYVSNGPFEEGEFIDWLNKMEQKMILSSKTKAVLNAKKKIKRSMPIPSKRLARLWLVSSIAAVYVS